MGTNELILTKHQAGMEITRGTGVAATRKLYAQITPSYDKPLMEFADQSGTFIDRQRQAYGREKIGFSAKDLGTYEDLPWWAQLFMKGGVSGVAGTGSPLPYTYTFTVTPATDDLKSISLEHGEPGNVYKTTQVMVKSWTLRIDADNDQEPALMLDLELMGLDWTTTTYTVAIPDRVTEVILARGFKLFIDDIGGTIGTTQKLGKLINASITGDTGIHFKAFSENVSGYAPNKVGRNAYRIDAQFTFEFDDDVEFAKYRNTAPQPRLIRLAQTGSQINTAPTNKSFTFDFHSLLWKSWSRSDRDGNLTAVFGGAAFNNITAGKMVEMVIVNSLISLP